jgi:hypothetical protein
MKKLLLFFTLLLLMGFIKLNWQEQKINAFIKLKKQTAYSCSPAFERVTDSTMGGKFITVLPGWGHYGYPVSTKSDSAQFYFNQGLNMYYSYHWREANASFKESARFDTTLAMAYWGEALSQGPGYNFSLHYKMREEIPAALQLMNRHAGVASAKEKKLMEVMNLRYTTDTSDVQRKSLNIAYAKGMRNLLSLYPDDADIKILYVDAMMLIHAWDMWNNDGTPKSWTPEMVRLCEEVLKENPKHPAALHYYIHLTEASRHPEIALESANTLKNIMPGVGHMVHMSSHEYERNGSYALGVHVNDLADSDASNYAGMANNIHLSPHVPHLFAVQTFCGLSGAMYRKGMSDAIRCRNSVKPAFDENYLQYLYMFPSFLLVRMGRWEEILKEELKPDSGWIYAGIIYDFARGMAFVNTGHPDSASSYLSLMQKNSKNSILAETDTLENSALRGSMEAKEILTASILFHEKKYDSAIRHITRAIRIEDSLFYSEPKDWMLPARQYLGLFYLKLNKPALAEKVYKEDLIWNPGNGWSNLGLYQSLKKQNKTSVLGKYQKTYLHAFSGAEKLPPASAYINE